MKSRHIASLFVVEQKAGAWVILDKKQGQGLYWAKSRGTGNIGQKAGAGVILGKSRGRGNIGQKQGQG